MADDAAKHQAHPPREELVRIKERLRAGRLQKEDVEVLERIVLDVERASLALRAAMVE